MFVGVPFRTVLFTVFQSICEVFLLCLAGFLLSFKGIVDKPTSKVLNHLNVALFTPALLFSKVAFFLSPGMSLPFSPVPSLTTSPAKLRQLWVIPIFFVVVTTLSAVVAHCLARGFRLRRSQVNFATAASMFMNSNSLPVALMQSLATTVPLLKRSPDDTLDAMFGRSLTYLVVFSTLGMMHLITMSFSYVGLTAFISSQAQTSQNQSVPPPSIYRDYADSQHTPLIPVDSSTTSRLLDYDTEPEVRKVWRTRPLRSRLPHPRLAHRRHTHPHLHSHLPAVPTSLGDQSESEDTDDFDTTGNDSEDTLALQADTGFSTEAEDTTPVPPLTSLPPSASLQDIYVTLPTSHCIASRPRRRTGSAAPAVAPIRRDDPVRGALTNAGECSIPLTLIVLGGWFWEGESKGKGKNGHAAQDSQGNAKGKGKGIEKGRDYGSTLVCERPSLSHTSTIDEHHDTRDASTTSASSVIGVLGGILMAPIRTCAISGHRGEADVESGELATHTENQSVQNSSGRSHASASRSRSRSHAQADPTHMRLPVSASPAPPTNPPGETLTIVVTLLARMVIVPMVFTPFMVLISRLGWGGEVFEDPVFIVSSMLLISSPPALTLAQISQKATAATAADTKSPFERLLSRTVFWAYLVLTPPVTIVSVMVGLLLVEA
ncbi:membrane transport protein-domain-containing protein [Chiua virens]|nr:membrane transport protein-domain-containing protein [Chiua virens]